MENASQFISFFRLSSPYINQHRGKTFVICIQENQETELAIKTILQDILILHTLQIKVVIVIGVRHSLNQKLKNQQFYQNQRITDKEDVDNILQVIGGALIKTKSMLSVGLSNTTTKNHRLEVCTGNFITARPKGIVNGVDFGLTGEIRKINYQSIIKHIDHQDIVLVGPTGFSSTGEVFNLTSEEVASEIAIAIDADKLLFFSNEKELFSKQSIGGNNITVSEAKKWSEKSEYSQETQTLLAYAAYACQKGVARAHVLPQYIEGSILMELFTTDGLGLMVTNEAYDRIEKATVQDIPSLLALIRPLEQKGVLIKRSRKLLEMEIDSFILLKRDNSVIGCAALYPYESEKMAELACLVVSEDYQKFGLANKLLQVIEQKAKKKGVKQLFCLTTQASHWFIERGFSPVKLDKLPEKKQNFYNLSRNSKPYLKAL